MSVNVHFDVCLNVLNSIERIPRLNAVHTGVWVVQLKLEPLRNIIEPLLRHGINITGNDFGCHVDPSRTAILVRRRSDKSGSVGSQQSRKNENEWLHG
jgi:hypothetical protein